MVRYWGQNRPFLTPPQMMRIDSSLNRDCPFDTTNYNDTTFMTPENITMSRTFAYCRVSTVGQTTENQIQEIKAAGFNLQPQRAIEETISGSTSTNERAGFNKLLERMEPGDVLVVTKLDRLGRNAIDVQSTVELLESKGIRVHCLALGGVDLTSAAGKMTMGVLAAVAQFERDLLIERTQAGLQRTKASGTKLGRPAAASVEDVRTLKLEGLSQSAIAARLDVSLSTVKRLWAKSLIDFQSINSIKE